MKLLCLSNPTSGSGRGKNATTETIELLKKNNVNTELVFSQFPGNFLQFSGNFSLNNFDGIVIIGGDGTLFEVVNGLFNNFPELSLPVGIIPVGTGNSFAHDLCIKNPAEAVELVLRNKPKPIDVGYFTTSDKKYFFMNLVGIGFVSDVCEWANHRKYLGQFSYVAGVIVKTILLNDYDLVLEIDGKKYERSNTFVEICNSRYTGGEMLMAPNAKFDDGLLDIVLLNKVSRRKLLQSFPKIFKGTHVNMDETEIFQGKEITIHTNTPKILAPDGEILGSTPCTFGILPGKINLFQ